MSTSFYEGIERSAIEYLQDYAECERDCTDNVVMVAVPYSPVNVTKESQMKSTKLCVPVLGSLMILALSLPVMAQSTTKSDSAATPDSMPAASQPPTSSAPDSAAPAPTKQESTAPGSMSQDYNAPGSKAPAAKQDSAAPMKCCTPDSKAPAAGKQDPADPYTNPPKTSEKTKEEMEH
jgi:hypothetical protein